MIIKDQKGGALIEFAIVLIFLVPLAIGIIEFGLLVYNKHIIANASREGARAGIVSGEGHSVDADIKDIVKNYCSQRIIDFNGTSLADDDIDLTPQTYAARQLAGFGSDFSVKVTYDYGFLVPGLFNMGTTTTIAAETLMKMEQAIGS